MQGHDYLRWSDQHQSKGSSLNRQSAACDAFSAELGWNTVERMIDDGQSAFSGANLDKGLLGKFEKRVRAGELHTHGLMVEKIDRLSRADAFDSLRWLGDMVECGLTIAVADIRMVIDAASIRNQKHQLRALLDEMDKANAYSVTLSSRVRAAWQTMRDGKTVLADHGGIVARLSLVGALQDVTRIEISRGKRTDTYWVNTLHSPLIAGDSVRDGQALGTLCQKVHADSTCPAWLKLVEHRTAFEIRYDIASVIERIFCLYVQTDLGARGIAKRLNGEGVATLRDGRCWHGSTIKAIIANRAVVGEYEHAVKRQKTGVIVGEYFPRIITDELFQAANDLRLKRIKSNHSRTSRLRHLFSDVGRCFKCDAKLTYVTKRTTAAGRFDAYAMCQSAYLNTGCDQKASLRMMPIEDAVLDKLLELALDDEHFIDEHDLPELRREIAEKKRALDGIERRIETLLDLIDDPSFQRDNRFNLRLRTATNEEIAAKSLLQDAAERLNTAQGQVTPQEHVTRVSAVRAHLWSTDEARGCEARRKVKMALNDLLDAFMVSVEHRKVVLVLKGGVRHLVLDWTGRITADVPIYRDRSLATDSPSIRAYFDRLNKRAA